MFPTTILYMGFSPSLYLPEMAHV